jgi:hypothetical protein
MVPAAIIGNEVIRSVKTSVNNLSIGANAVNRRAATAADRRFLTLGCGGIGQRTNEWTTARRQCAARGLPHVEHIHPLADGSSGPEH